MRSNPCTAKWAGITDILAKTFPASVTANAIGAEEPNELLLKLVVIGSLNVNLLEFMEADDKSNGR
jgi:hypothetical protein